MSRFPGGLAFVLALLGGTVLVSSVSASPSGGAGRAVSAAPPAVATNDEANFRDPYKERVDQLVASPPRQAAEQSLKQVVVRAMSSGTAGGAAPSAFVLQGDSLAQGFRAPFMPRFQPQAIQARDRRGEKEMIFLGAGESPQAWQNSFSVSAITSGKPALPFGPSYNRSLLSNYSDSCLGTPVLAELGTYRLGADPANLLVVGCGLMPGQPPRGEASLLFQVAGNTDLFVVRWTKRVPGGFNNPTGPFSQQEISDFVASMRTAQVVPKAANASKIPVVGERSSPSVQRTAPSASTGVVQGGRVQPYIPGVGVVKPNSGGGIRPFIPSFSRPAAPDTPSDTKQP